MFLPFFLDFEPGLFPIVGILLVETEHIGDALVEFAFCRDGFQGFVHDEFYIVRNEGQRIHGGDVDASVIAVPVVHDVSDLIAHADCRIDHARGHQPGEVGFDLKVDVVCMEIILPVARFRRLDAVEQVVAGCLVGMPQRISCMREGVCEGVHRGIQSQAVENLHESGIHVYVVI